MPEIDNIINSEQGLKQRYLQLVADRQPYIDRARFIAKFTISSLYPPEGFNKTSLLETPYQSIGAEGVNNLASKLLLGLFPPNSPFYKLSLTEEQMIKIADLIVANGGDIDDAKEVDQEIAAVFSNVESKLQKDLDSKGNRKTFSEGLKHLLIAGNCLVVIYPDGTSRLYTLFHYVLKRDTKGTLLEVIVRDIVDRNTLPEHVREVIKTSNPEDQGFIEKVTNNLISVFSSTTSDSTPKPKSNEVEIYTCQKRIVENGVAKWLIWQEVEGEKIEESVSKLPIDDMPFIPLRMYNVDGEDWGRSYIEDYLGDLVSLDGLERGLLEIIAEAARSLIGVRNNAQNKKLASEIVSKPNGSPILMNEGDVFPVELGKRGDFGMLTTGISRKEQRLARVFLLFQSLQRDAERVTAEEIRAIIQQLDDLLGGFFSTFAHEAQLAVIKRKLATMRRRGEIPQLGFDVLDISITTGIEALGRSQDLQKLNAYINTIAAAVATLGPMLNVDNLDRRVSTALHFDSKGILKSEEQLRQEQEEQQQRELMNQLTPQVVDKAGSLIQEGVKANVEQETTS